MTSAASKTRTAQSKTVARKAPPARWKFDRSAIVQEEINDVVAKLKRKLRLTAPAQHKDAIGRALLNAEFGLRLIHDAARTSAKERRQESKKVREAAKLAGQLITLLVETSAIRSGMQRALLDQVFVKIFGTTRLPANGTVHELRQFAQPRLRGHVAKLIEAVVEVGNLLEGTPQMRGVAWEHSPTIEWRQAVVDELVAAYELIHGKPLVDAPGDYRSLVKFVHDLAGQKGCDCEKARTFAPANRASRQKHSERKRQAALAAKE